jgi:hypothetical protein
MRTHAKKPPPNAPLSNISCGVTFGVNTPFHLPSKISVPSASRAGIGWGSNSAEPGMEEEEVVVGSS